jgi:hypothetical protein
MRQGTQAFSLILANQPAHRLVGVSNGLCALPIGAHPTGIRRWGFEPIGNPR